MMINRKKMLHERNGIALLMVLVVIMAITVLSMVYICKSNAELNCGINIQVRNSLDDLAMSGLQQVRGFLLYPQDVVGASAYWTGDTGIQLDNGSDYFYDLTVSRNDVGSGSRCLYDVTSLAYKEDNGIRSASSLLKGQVCIDPAVALYIDSDSDVTLASGVVINGDVFCNKELSVDSTVYGDVYGELESGSASGEIYDKSDLNVNKPNIKPSDFYPYFYYDKTAYSPSTFTPNNYYNYGYYNPGNPLKIMYCDGDLNVVSNCYFNGTLVVKGNLTIYGNQNQFVSPNSRPAIIVGGTITMMNGSTMYAKGLIITDDFKIQNSASVNASINGALFIKEGSMHGFDNFSGSFRINSYPLESSVRVWKGSGNLYDFSPAGDAFLKFVSR